VFSYLLPGIRLLRSFLTVPRHGSGRMVPQRDAANQEHGRSEARQTAAGSPEGETNEVSESITPRPTAPSPSRVMPHAPTARRKPATPTAFEAPPRRHRLRPCLRFPPPPHQDQPQRAKNQHRSHRVHVRQMATAQTEEAKTNQEKCATMKLMHIPTLYLDTSVIGGYFDD
jgi:hypothetical protein